MTLGERLKLIRKSRKLTQEELASKMNCSKMLISIYENDKRNPKPDTIKKFMEALDCSMEELGYTVNYWGNIDQLPVNDKSQEIIKAMELLNDDGKEKVLNYILDLSKNPDYKLINNTIPEI